MAQHAEQAAHVARVQTDGGLVERVHRGGQQAAERAREMDTLGLAARERARLALDRQVAESDLVEIADAAFKLAQHDAGALGRARLAAELLQPSLELAHREPSGLRDSNSVDAHVERFGLELGAAAGGAGDEAAVACEQDPDVGLVAPLLHPAEKSAHPRPSLPIIAVRAIPRALARAVTRLAVEQPRALGLGHFAKRHGGAHPCAPCALEHPGLHLQVGRCAPRRDQALAQREPGVGDDFFEIELDGASEALAFGARADRTVGGKQSRRGLGKQCAAGRAVEAAIVGGVGNRRHPPVLAHHGDHAGAPAAEIEGLLQRLAHASGSVGGIVGDAVGDDHQRPAAVAPGGRRRSRAAPRAVAGGAVCAMRQVRGCGIGRGLAARRPLLRRLRRPARCRLRRLARCLAQRLARRLAPRVPAARRSRRSRRRRTADGIRSARETRRRPRSSASRARRARETDASPGPRARGPPRSRHCRA